MAGNYIPTPLKVTIIFQDYPHQLTFQGTEHEALSSHDLSHHRHGPYIMDDRSGMSTEQTE